MSSVSPAAPIGVFDSGIGGLSILRALRQTLSHEDFVYFADSAHAPYGERDDAHVIARATAITAGLLARHHIKALVVACNTATAAAIAVLRQQHPGLPVIGIEPALKPAVALSKTGRIGVMATRGTIRSAKFQTLLQSLAGQGEFVCQPCDGLANAIECADAPRTETICAQSIGAMGQFGAQAGQIDTLVLGCTHYPFCAALIRQMVGPGVTITDNGEPVARQLARVIGSRQNHAQHHGVCRFECSGKSAQLQSALAHWLHTDSPVTVVSEP